MIYFHSADFNAQAEGCVNALDPLIDIKWPAEITQRSPRDEDQEF